MAVSVQEIRASHASFLPIFKIGSSDAFHDSGLVPVSISRKSMNKATMSPEEAQMRAILKLAALFHDIGKATRMFQDKLAASMAQGGKGLADPVRHELFSAIVLDLLFEQAGETDAGFLAWCGRSLPQDLDIACRKAGKELTRDARRGKMTGQYERDFRILLKSPSGPTAAALHLVLSHHRLAEHLPDLPETLRLGALVSPGLTGEITSDSFSIPAAVPIWRDEDWQGELAATAATIDPDFRLEPGFLPIARAALMFADHIGSAEKERQTEDRTGTADELLANTDRTTEIVKGREQVVVHPYDSLKTHVARVVKETRRACRLVANDTSLLPGLTRSECPEAIAVPPAAAHPRFAWQARAAAAVGEAVAADPGGFFACIAAGTGTGKTRAAPTILAAAAFNDADPDRQRLRYNLGLGLRTLADQSGREYVEDLGFGPDDVAIRIGGVTIDWAAVEESETLAEASGSEDRLAGDRDANVSRMRELMADSIPADGDESPAWLRSLSHTEGARELPAFLDRILEHERRNQASLRAFLATPILSATIDHFMSVTDAQRSKHLLALLRVFSSDLIIDELDLFSEEDMAAIGRLVYLAALGGRRVIIMSATLPRDVAITMHAAYAAGWSHYARRTGAAPHVHLACISEVEGGLHLNAGQDRETSFSDLYDRMSGAVCAHLETAPALRRAEPLPVGADFDMTAAEILDACHRMHGRHATEVAGYSVSAGLIRITRVKHLQELARIMAAQGSPDPARHLEFVFLHSSLPHARRSYIEYSLGKALRRKDDPASRNLERFLERQGVFERAARAGASDIMLVVLSSPVIETGNDLDFDYAVIDPSSLRAIIQAAGRVNRHRCAAIAPDTPNLSILTEYLVSALDPAAGGAMLNPGVETRPARETGLSGVTIEGGKNFFGDLLPAGALETVDARLALDPSGGGVLQARERDLRVQYFGGLCALGDFASLPAAQLSSAFATKRRFRRGSGVEIDIEPRMRPDGSLETGWIYRAPGTVTDALVPVDLVRDPMLCALDVFREDGLASILQWLAGPGEGKESRALRQGFLSIREKEAFENLHIDESLGLIR